MHTKSKVVWLSALSCISLSGWANAETTLNVHPPEVRIWLITLNLIWHRNLRHLIPVSKLTLSAQDR
ncbi:hypothetical protein [Vibrio salinus]|uniref:hypothetical protein n=1 Tax=Vibrio salinus TaxID=2899784 RepID=UPI001E347E58|nr:hypothetical protein [Vibrio salinus]MCE0496130.1 hypothetical protein [Vibrio salinus]